VMVALAPNPPCRCRPATDAPRFLRRTQILIRLGHPLHDCPLT
jgi:hypothetical protein